jgi:hypothetical protein
MKAIIIAIHKDYIFNVERPLSLVKLYSVPLIVRMIYSLKSAGITDILILIEFKGKQILELIGDGRDIGMEIQYIEYSADADISPTIPDRFLKEDLLIVYDNVVFDTEFVRIAIETMGSSTFYLEGKPIGVYKLDRELLMNICMKYHCMYVRELLHYIEKSSDLAIIDVSTYLVESVELKRKVTPICIKIIDKDSLKYAKKAIISRIQKGLHFTAYINKPLEDYIVYRIGDIPWITPNRITILANIAAFIVAMLFLYWDLLPTSILAYLVGIADLATVFAENAALADAAATKLCNMVDMESKDRVEDALRDTYRIPGVKGCLVVVGGYIGYAGWHPRILEISIREATNPTVSMNRSSEQLSLDV